jgi:hypothetical protein
MSLLSSMWPTAPVTAERLAAYWLVLQDLDDGVMTSAVERGLREWRFFPVPAEILTQARLVVAERLRVRDADSAWNAVLAVARGWAERGRPVRHEFSELEWQAVATIGGMRAVALTETDELDYLRRAFIEIYERMLTRELSEAVALGAAIPTPVPISAGRR